MSGAGKGPNGTLRLLIAVAGVVGALVMVGRWVGDVETKLALIEKQLEHIDERLEYHHGE